jgi:hypothetical protein
VPPLWPQCTAPAGGLPGSADRAPAIIDAVPRNDPTDTGGLFIGRRPGTAPVHYRTPPERGGARRRRTDGILAAAVLVLEVLVVLSVWGPQPVAWMWVGSQLDYLTGSVFLGIACAFFGLIGTLILTLMLATRLDGLWQLLRRAAGHDQRDGVLGRIFVVTAIVAAVGFTAWFLLLEGPGSSLAPR